MIKIKKSNTADTRTCDFKHVPKQTLLNSSKQHIQDVGKALGFFSAMLAESASIHDYDKLTDIDLFYHDFRTGFKETTWWDNHRKIHRHHLAQEDGVPEDVNLVDVIEYISDCTMAGKARSGIVTEINIDPVVLIKAFKNTCELLKKNVELEDETD